MPDFPHAPPRSSTHSAPRIIRDRRWWLALLLAWAILVGTYTSNHVAEIGQQTTEVALAGARNMFRMVVLTRNWNAAHGGVYVPVTAKTPPNPYLHHPLRDLTTTTGLQLTMINPAYMTRLIGEMAEADAGAIFRLTSLKPVRPENAPDDWEALALQAFERGENEVHAITSGALGLQLRYMAPLRVKESCLACHGDQGYRLDDVRGGISVTQDYAPVAATLRQHAAEAWMTAAIIFTLIALSGGLALNTLRRRWLELAGKMQELEATQSQLLQAEKMASIGQLAAGVAHEINNPVGFVHSNLGTLQKYSTQLLALLDRSRAGQASEADFQQADYDYLKGDIRDLIAESQDGLQRVRKIVADLKDFSRIDHAEMAAADLNAGIKSTLNVVWNELKYKAEVVLELGDIPPVTCIAAQINQVLMNLLVNAAQAIGERGTITIRSGQGEHRVWIEVEDSGCGMPADVLAHIFEPFYTTKPVGKGTGLGLSLSYDIIHKHGGQIEVQSQPGQGSCFRIVLPVSPDAVG